MSNEHANHSSHHTELSFHLKSPAAHNTFPSSIFYSAFKRELSNTSLNFNLSIWITLYYSFWRNSGSVYFFLYIFPILCWPTFHAVCVPLEVFSVASLTSQTAANNTAFLLNTISASLPDNRCHLLEKTCINQFSADKYRVFFSGVYRWRSVIICSLRMTTFHFCRWWQ